MPSVLLRNDLCSGSGCWGKVLRCRSLSPPFISSTRPAALDSLQRSRLQGPGVPAGDGMPGNQDEAVAVAVL